MEAGTLIHMLLAYRFFYNEVVSTLNYVGGLSIARDPLIFILGMTDNVATTRYVKLFIFYLTFSASQNILI